MRQSGLLDVVLSATYDFTAADSVIYAVYSRVGGLALSEYDCTSQEMTCTDGSVSIKEAVADIGCLAGRTCWHELLIRESGDPARAVWLSGPLRVKRRGERGSTTAGQQTLTVNTVAGASITITAVSSIGDNTVTLSNLAHGTPGKVIGFDGSGVPAELDAGGSATECATASCTLNASTTLDGAAIVTTDGSQILTNKIIDGDDNIIRDLALNMFRTGTARAVLDTGDGSKGMATLTPTAGTYKVDCQDTDGCDITLGETSMEEGYPLDIVCISSNTCDFADTAGVSELAGAASLGLKDSLTLKYLDGGWIKFHRSDN